MKYLRKIIDALKDFKTGMLINAARWVGQSETPATVQAAVDELEAKEAEIIALKQNLSVKLAEARALRSVKDVYAEGLENLARGLHSSDPEKLIEYGIPPEPVRTPANPPTMVLSLIIKDDTDGVGFRVSLQSADPDAENYEYEKGVGADPTVTGIVPEMSHFKLTTKISFVDDDVLRGRRCFYRVRAINRKGVGPWSEAVSSVQ